MNSARSPIERRVHLFLDDAVKLDFHAAFAAEGQRTVSELAAALGSSSSPELHECHGKQSTQRKLVLDLASKLHVDTEDLVCLFPTDAYATSELQSVLFAPSFRRRRLVCAVIHQFLSEALVEEARRVHKRLFAVGADQVKMGQLQAKQILRLLSAKAERERRIVYMSGPNHSIATRLRIAGAVEPLLDAGIVVEATHAEWSGNKAAEALQNWSTAGNLETLDAVAAQNDQMAQAAKNWLIERGYGTIPVFGMDGTDALGKRLVAEGKLAATVEQPLGVTEVFELYRAILSDERALDDVLRQPNRKLEPRSFPALEDLAPLAPF